MPISEAERAGHRRNLPDNSLHEQRCRDDPGCDISMAKITRNEADVSRSGQATPRALRLSPPKS